MTEPLEPDWGLLPDQPQAFFGLAAGFDRKALKRCYNRYIRSFKPERQPQEFKLIRAAYEALDSHLRYFGTEEAPSPEQCVPEAEQALAVSAFDTSARLAETPLPELYAELSALPEKEPEHYFHLAVLSDVIDENHRLAFFYWLMEGLRATSGDPGLANVLVDACHAEVPREDVPELLRDLAKVLRGNYYYFVTEALWLVYLRSVDFEEFALTLEECGREVGEEGFFGHLVMLVFLIKHGIWRCDDAWLVEGARLLDEYHHELPDHLFFELDLIEGLLGYRQNRAEFLDGDPIREHVDAALRAVSEEAEDVAERRFIESQLAILDGGADVLDSFPIGSQDFNYALHPMLWLARDLVERGDEEPAPFQVAATQAKVEGWMHRMEKATDRSVPGRWWNRLNVLVLVLATLFLVLPIGFVASLTENQWAHGGFLVVWLAFFFFGVRRVWYRFRGERLNPWFARHCYLSVWRPAIAELLYATHISVDELEQSIVAIDDSTITNGPWMVLYMQQDFGIEFLSMALQTTA